MKIRLPFIILVLFFQSLLAQNVIQVAAGNDGIATAYASAQAGDIIELTSDGGIYNESAVTDITLEKGIVIRGASNLTNPPIWQSTASPFLSVGGNIEIENVILQGVTGQRAINTTYSTGFYIKLKNCTVKGFDYIIYGSTGGSADSVVINNCVLRDISNRALYFPAGTVDPGITKRLSVKNTTFYNMKQTEPCIYFYSKSSPTYSPRLELDHVTFYNAQRIRTNSTVTDVEIKNTIFATDGSISGGQSFNLYGGNVSNSLIFNAPVSGTGANYTNFLDNVDPLFTDPANGDLTLQASSPAANAGTDGTSLGDARWWPKLANVHYIEAGTNKISNALNIANPGDIIELITDGGLYTESATLLINKDVTFRAASYLSSKPTLTSDDGNYLIRTQANLKLISVILDGSKGLSNSVGGIVLDSNGYSIKIDNCEFLNFTNIDSTDGHAIFDGIYNSQLDSLIITGTTFKNILRQGIYLNGHAATEVGTVKYFSISNSTFQKIKDDAIYVRDHDGIDSTPGPFFLVDHCTFYDCFASYGVLAHHIDGAVIKNSIAMSSTGIGNAYYIYGNSSILKNSLYFGTTINLHTSISENNIKADPLFVNAESGNFMLFKNSPAVNAGDDGLSLGDLRWGVSDQNSNQLALIKNPFSNSPAENSVRIVWQTPLNTSVASIVQYGSTSALGSTVNGNDGWLIPGEGYIHEVTLIGLEPSTNYYYKVGDGTYFSEDINITKTAPQKGTDFRLVSLSDIHANDDNLWADISTRILSDSADMTVFIGDFVNDGSLRTEWDGGFFSPGEGLLSKIPIISAVGNHETAFGPSTYYDYFSFPTHPENGDGPEAYYSMNYGDVKIICINSNGDDYSPTYITDSPQLLWLEDQIKNADTKWIFIFSHTNVISTSYHAQWSANEKTYLMPLYEKYAAEGKHILVFAGDEHNFEHLYKNGVNYIRPGCANNSLRNTDLNLVDKPYSQYFKKTNGYSTLDISNNGDIVTLLARDAAGTVFYTATFTTSSTPPPTIFISEPDGIDDVCDSFYKIQWVDSDPDDNAAISLYYSQDAGSPGNLIVENISEDDPNNYFIWDVSEVPIGSYYIYGTISDGENPPVTRYSSGMVTINPDTVAPPAVIDLNGTVAGNKITLTWVNPTKPIPIEKSLATFEDSLDDFIGQPHGTSTGSLEIVPGSTGNALKINYQIAVAWDQYAGIKVIHDFPNFSSTPFLDFWYRGDGSNRSLRLIVEQDNDRNNSSDDWWYIEAQDLSSTEWKHAVVDMSTFSALSWHPNVEATFDLENIASIDFIIPSATPGTGYIELDEIKITGEILAAPDFAGVMIFRRTDRFPQNIYDGELIYQGNLETCVDSTISSNEFYYYSVFAYDDVPNYSALDSTSSWQSPLIVGVEKDVMNLPKEFELGQNYPNPFNPSTTIKFALPKSSMVKLTLYNALGQEVRVITETILEAGYHSVDFNAKSLSSGIYFYKMEADNFLSFKKMMLLK